jgi:EAL domain-containing protein (putative c-di-GMP-specific phosphodiesterase class I)
VNISLRQLLDSSFADTVTTALSATGVDPSCVRLEITETALLEATRSATADLFALESQGVGIGLDDFGTGYSSLAHLSQYPVRFLKIDRSFVSRVAAHLEDAAIADAVLRMGQSLGLEVIAQGIETAGDLQALRALGCTFGQGFHLAMPSSADDISDLLAHSSATSA